MKYFFYISDAKVDMLYDQIGTETEKKSKTLFKSGIGNWLSIEHHKESNEEVGTNSIQKLDKILEYIRKDETVSTLDNIKGSWVEDTFCCYVSYPVLLATNIPVVLLHWQSPFECEPMNANQHMLLVGSSAYLMPRGNRAQLSVPTLPPGGHWTELATILSGILDGTNNENALDNNGEWLLNSTDGPFGLRDPSKILSVKAMFRVMHKQTICQKEIILGTPLYIEF